MKLYHSIKEFTPDFRPIITLGTFDGVHLGHQFILKRMNELAKKQNGESVLLTFYPHPRMVLYPDNQQLSLINTLEENKEQLEQSGLQHLIIQDFTKEFSRMKSANFVRDVLVNQLKVHQLIIGYDHHFGRNRKGTYEELIQLAQLYHFQLEKIPVQQLSNIAVSSTKIRNAIATGAMMQANKYLNYTFMINGTVVQGKSIGKTIGFPTANIALSNQWKILPADGVYAVQVRLKEDHFYGMMNIGINPTFDGTVKSIEVHIFEFNQEIYGADIKVSIVARVREEKKFDSREQLKKQLNIDKHKCMKLLGIMQ